jgi:hypothetical protein
MRCLYCGKELALLKRWTGGGEFCSDAHRLRYQEEYNQLALNRLLQAKPPVQPNEATAPEAKASKPVPVVETPAPAYTAPWANPAAPEVATLKKPAAYEPPAPIAVQPAPPVAAVAIEETAPPDEPAPAEIAGFVVEMPAAALAEVAPMACPDLEFLDAVSSALPNRDFEPLYLRHDAYGLETAGLVTYEPNNRVSNYVAASAKDRKLEVREFMRANPIVEIKLTPAGETGLETTREAMDILIFPHPPQASPSLWQEPPVGFGERETQLGDLARLSFSTTGLSGEEQSVEQEPTVAAALAELPENPADAIVAEVLSDLLPEPQPEAQAEPVPEPAAVLIEPAAGLPEPAAVLPEPATKPLPLVLHLSAPGKGKPVQVFSAAASAVEAQVPRSTSLPLRALMTFGPAPAAVRNEVKSEARPEPKKPVAAPVRPDPRLGLQKPVAKPEIAAVLKPAAKPDAKPEKKPEAKETVKLIKEDTKATPILPAPLAAPYPGSNDLGLPRLMESSPGFLGQIPILAKVAIMLVLLAGLGGFIVFSSKTGGAATTGNGGAIVAGSALPAGETGWITNWGADPGVRRTRQISILRSSQTLTDYRIEMNGQIESKAIGWVFRAADPKNFYVTKLEIVKPGLEPTVALVRFAIINGEEQAHAQLPLPMKVRLDTMYKIRFDAVGDHFTTYVQDQKIDDWTDGHIKTGGVGFYRESGEDATLKGGMNVVPLIIKK